MIAYLIPLDALLACIANKLKANQLGMTSERPDTKPIKLPMTRNIDFSTPQFFESEIDLQFGSFKSRPDQGEKF